jgi:hypothetical protein
MQFTKDQFVQKLKAGDYDKIGGARIAVGRSKKMSNKEKTECKELIDKYFANKSNGSQKKATRAKKTVAKESRAPKAKLADKRDAICGISKKELDAVSLAHYQVETITHAVESVKMAKDMVKDLDVTTAVTSAAQALTGIVENMKKSILGSKEPSEVQKFCESVKETNLA